MEAAPYAQEPAPEYRAHAPADTCAPLREHLDSTDQAGTDAGAFPFPTDSAGGRRVDDAAGTTAPNIQDVFSPAPVAAVETADSLGGIRWWRAGLVAAAAGGIVTAVHLYQQNAWWQGARAPFRLENDWSYALNLDKCGHAFGAYLAASLFGGALDWSGLGPTRSVFYGSMLGLAYQLYVEVEDGFHREYGFSPGDGIADITGALVPLLRLEYPALACLRPKWSYAPSRQYLDDVRSGKSRAFIDDYQGQTFWLTVDPHPLVGSTISGALPSWLGLAVGAASRNLDGSGGGDRIFYLALDYNLSAIDTGSSLLRTIFRAIDFFHLPAPGIALRNGKLTLGLYY
jgi:hypothetical protein